MNLQLATEIDKIARSGPNIFLALNPEIVDFTKSRFSVDLNFMTKNYSLTINLNNDNLIEVISLIKAAILTESLSLIGWNIKNLFTLVKFATACNLEFINKILDLKVAEAYAGLHNKCPVSFNEMVIRIKGLLINSSWQKFKNLYQRIYLPLITEVIPNIESCGVFDNSIKKLVYPYYEIEGQVNGRLSCHLAYEDCFNPHSLTEMRKVELFPKHNELAFLYFDYRHIEVSMLAWLSHDTVLIDLICQDIDFYKQLFKILFNSECDTDDKRSFCKNIFLPLVFGQSAHSIAEKHNLEVHTAIKLVDKLRNMFSESFTWVENYGSENGLYEDHFGRKRIFNQSDEYKYRNFIIQSPAALFYLEKLVKLYKDLGNYGDIVAHIHDGYVICASEKQIETVRLICLKSLCEDSVICPGLKLKVGCKISKTL